MARATARMITKEVSVSKRLPQLSKEALVLFFLLIPHQDSHGKMNGDPHFIKGEVCPRFSWLTPKKIEECLKEISDKTSIKWFEHEGLKYIHSLNFMEHQPGLRPEKAGKDIYPSYLLENKIKNIQDGVGAELGRTKGRLKTEQVPHEVEVEVEVEVEEEVEEEEEIEGDALTRRFEVFWKAYPKRRSKGQAEKAWKKIKPSEQLLATMLATIERAKTSVEWAKDGGQFIPHPATWLNAKGWKDEYTPAQETRGTPKTAGNWELLRRRKKERENAGNG